jgi:hypothetical protein
MSSAILYLAIVAIWACVLIPRWLKRDSARGAAVPEPAATPEPVVAAEPETAPVDAGRLAGEPADDADDDSAGEQTVQPVTPAFQPAYPADSRRRMLAARRRLLLMLIGLEVAAIALGMTGLAAVWVVIPPTVMLAGYLLLLREAAQADAEQATREAEAAERARERARERREARAGTPTEASVPEAAAALAARLAAAPVAADYEEASPGRDFAPGLAGKYTTSNADADSEEDEYYDGYEVPRLRAVGD